MEFISTEDMNKFTELGYTFTSKYTPCKIGRTYHVIVTDKDGNEVVHTKCSYGNGSGHGYAMSGAVTQAVADLKAIINNEVTDKEEYDTDFLSKLVKWDYINDYGYTTDGELMILFDGWYQVEGNKHFDKKKNEWVVTSKSVYAKLEELAEKDLLKPSINKTIKEVEYAFTDSMRRCTRCGRIIDIEWEGLNYIEEIGEELCDDCINESESAIEALIEEAKDDFSKALPVMISEDKIKELGYEAVDDTDFSTRSSQWGEDSWSCHNLDTDTCKRLCCDYNGFAKLTGVYQFEAEFQLYFPSNTVEQAREELKTIL